ncbi:MAG TPA: BlaI/MecI/CopY family transcriptional regulator [Chthonomonadales bacterium]|nr:BlaI/MecI/CopY family transcriptional regulator [Chthonomonadales bacterium]
MGRLELKVLEALWQRKGSSTVRQLRPVFPRLAYTTLMTTLDRLYKKGLLRRSQLGLAFGYEPLCSHREVLGQMAFSGVTDLLSLPGNNRALLSTLVQAVGRVDAELLNELEALVHAERMRLELKRE